MKAIQKQFESNNLFPFQILYQDSKSQSRELPFHFHEWYELVYVHSGNGTFFIDQSVHSMESGNLFIIPSNIIHRAQPDQITPVTSTAIFFHPILIQQRQLGDSFHFLHLFESCIREKSYKFKVQTSEQTIIERDLSFIQKETLKKHPGYRQAILAQLHLFLLFLSRTLPNVDNHSLTQNEYGPIWMNDIFSYIERYYMNGISLETLSKHGNVSTAHLSRVFKKITGLNISEFITTKKILKAKELLVRTDQNVANIARECGFDSLPYFHRTFKKYNGVTPSEYRKNKL